MPTCMPIRDMKDTAKFVQTVEQADGPVTVTKNGYSSLVVMTNDAFEAREREMRDKVAKSELLASIDRIERDYAEGKYQDGATAILAMREKYGL